MHLDDAAFIAEDASVAELALPFGGLETVKFFQTCVLLRASCSTAISPRAPTSPPTGFSQATAIVFEPAPGMPSSTS